MIVKKTNTNIVNKARAVVKTNAMMTPRMQRGGSFTISDQVNYNAAGLNIKNEKALGKDRHTGTTVFDCVRGSQTHGELLWQAQIANCSNWKFENMIVTIDTLAIRLFIPQALMNKLKKKKIKASSKKVMKALKEASMTSKFSGEVVQLERRKFPIIELKIDRKMWTPVLSGYVKILKTDEGVEKMLDLWAIELNRLAKYVK